MGKKNKVKFGLKNVHVATATFDDNGYPTFATPKRILGAVNLSLDKEGDPTKFYADDSDYYDINNNNGYSGDLEIAMIPEWFRTDILGDIKDSNGVLIENADAPTVYFALLFEFTGDANGIRHVLYKNSVSRPKIEGKTKEDSVEVKTDVLTLSSVFCKFNVNGQDIMTPKSKTDENTTDATYNNWYNTVYVPDTLSSSIKISGDSSVAAASTITLAANTVPSTADVVWSSNDEDIATVDGGVVTGVAAGKVVIMASLEDDASVFDTKVITVTAS